MFYSWIKKKNKKNIFMILLLIFAVFVCAYLEATAA